MWRLLICGCVFVLAGCEQYGRPAGEGTETDTNGTAKSPPAGKRLGEQPPPTTQPGVAAAAPAAAEFLREAVSDGLMEIELGRLAHEKGSDQQVKQFGQRMVDNHQMANAELLKAARKLNLDVPTTMGPEQQAQVDRFARLSGEEFDREYMSFMVKEHQQDIGKFETMARDASAGEVQAVAERTLPRLREHLDMARGISEDLREVAAAP